MRTKILFCLLFINFYYIHSQTTFKSGYFITNDNEKVECLIKDIDWKNSPENFEYKLSETSEVKENNALSVSEFRLGETIKFIRYTGKVDRSSDGILRTLKSDLNTHKEESVFLKVLIDGAADLLLYEETNYRFYFYALENEDAKQLRFKVYKTKENDIARERIYKQQLWNNLRCTGITMKEVDRLDYTRKDLTDFFIKYNTCRNVEFINYLSKDKRDYFNFSARLGINQTSLSTHSDVVPSRNVDFPEEYSLRVGAELEYVLPYNHGKWSIILEPTYQSYKSTNNSENTSTEVEYSSLEFPIGLRHYFLFNDRSKLFINGYYVLEKTLKAELYINKFAESDRTRVAPNLALGLGYQFDNRFSVEFKYTFKRKILFYSRFFTLESNYNSASVILGYRLF